MGLGFSNESPARKIFEGWRERYGTRDNEAELKITLVQDKIAGKNGEFTVTISSDTELILKRIQTERGLDTTAHMVSFSGLANRMEPAKPDVSDRGLTEFEAALSKHGRYYLAPYINVNRAGGTNIMDLALEVTNLKFVDTNDADYSKF